MDSLSMLSLIIQRALRKKNFFFFFLIEYPPENKGTACIIPNYILCTLKTTHKNITLELQRNQSSLSVTELKK